MLIVEELHLLLLRPDGRVESPVSVNRLYGEVAAVIVDLALHGRISVSDEKNPVIDIVSTEPTGNPILDTTLMRVPTFRLSVIGGSLTRITQGAQPFLLPLMLQLGFGLTAARTGTITMAGAIGALAMKALAPRVLRRWGFRNSLIVAGIASSAGYATCALFRPDWPVWGIVAVLGISGFFTSFQFTGYNAIAYADVDKDRMSAATSFYATFQQLTLSFGICTAATILELGKAAAHTTEPTLGTFSLAFVVVAGISASAVIWNRRFAADAGAAMSLHQPPAAAAGKA